MISLTRYDTIDTGNINTKTDYEALITQASSIDGYTRHNLRDSAGGRPSYGFSYGDMSKPCIIIDGSIHNAHEWKSAHGAVEIMRVIADPSLYPSAQDKINGLKNKYCFYFIPVLSPDSYTLGIRTNGNQVALDKNFDFEFTTALDMYGTSPGPSPFSEPESQNLRDVVLDNNTLIYVNLHSVGSPDNSIMLRRARMPISDSVITYLADEFDKVYPIQGKSALLNMIRSGSSSYNWVGAQQGYLGEQMESVVIEVGSSLDLPLTKSSTVWSVLTYLINVDDIKSEDIVDEPLANKRKKNMFLFDYAYHTLNR